MVRLEVHKEKYTDDQLGLFQFLMVRLEDNTSWLYSSIPFMFQFLMVRLEASSDRDAERPQVVSIPYGSIRSPVRRARS